MIEKKWIAYQLLNGLSQAHFYEICHGDIKTENIMVTSWNWIYIADFASYKPVYLSEVSIRMISQLKSHRIIQEQIFHIFLIQVKEELVT